VDSLPGWENLSNEARRDINDLIQRGDDQGDGLIRTEFESWRDGVPADRGPSATPGQEGETWVRSPTYHQAHTFLKQAFDANPSVVLVTGLVRERTSQDQARMGGIPKDAITYDYLMGIAPTGSLPKGIEVSPDGRWLYSANMSAREGNITIIDLKSREVVKKLTVPGGSKAIPGNVELTFSEDGKFAYVVRMDGAPKNAGEPAPGQGMVTVVDTESQAIVKYIPTRGAGSKIIRIAPEPDADGDQVAWIANWFSNDISVVKIDPERLRAGTGLLDDSAFKKTIQPKTMSPNAHGAKIAPRGINFTSDGKYAFVLGYKSKSIFVFDPKTGKQIAELPRNLTSGFRGSLRHVVLNSDETRMWISNMGSNKVFGLDLARLRKELETTQPGKDGIIWFDQGIWERCFVEWKDGGRSWNAIGVSHYPVDHSDFPDKDWYRAHPNTIVLHPNDRYLFVSNRTTHKEWGKVFEGTRKEVNLYEQDGKIDVIDTTTGKVIYSLVGGRESTGLAISPDGDTLISSDFRGNKVRFFDVRKLIEQYESRDPADHDPDELGPIAAADTARANH
jgi:DNA-binding beta-propeller fold protein YncE